MANAASPPLMREFKIVFDRYYWLTALLIAHNAITRVYRNSFLGMLWTLIQPLSTVTIYALIMPLIMHHKTQDYVLYLIVSVPLWTFIHNSITYASHSLMKASEALKRCVMSSTVFPISDVFRLGYTYLISFGVMYGFCIIFVTDFDPIVLLLPLYLLPVLAILMAGAVAIAFVAPYARDIGECVSLVMNICFWATPIIYPIAAVPEKYRIIFEFNPFYIMMRPAQQIVYGHHVPDAHATITLALLTAVTVTLCYAIYRKCRRNYIYYL